MTKVAALPGVVGVTWRLLAHLFLETANSLAFRDNKVANTKYTALSFVPKNLMEQFSRFLNVYFLMLAVVQLVPSITPVSPLTTWVPLFCIIVISAIKEASDDIQRRCVPLEFRPA
jgi:hypothetical protein